MPRPTETGPRSPPSPKAVLLGEPLAELRLLGREPAAHPPVERHRGDAADPAISGRNATSTRSWCGRGHGSHSTVKPSTTGRQAPERIGVGCQIGPTRERSGSDAAMSVTAFPLVAHVCQFVHLVSSRLHRLAPAAGF